MENLGPGAGAGARPGLHPRASSGGSNASSCRVAAMEGGSLPRALGVVQTAFGASRDLSASPETFRRLAEDSWRLPRPLGISLKTVGGSREVSAPCRRRSAVPENCRRLPRPLGAMPKTLGASRDLSASRRRLSAVPETFRRPAETLCASPKPFAVTPRDYGIVVRLRRRGTPGDAVRSTSLFPETRICPAVVHSSGKPGLRASPSSFARGEPPEASLASPSSQRVNGPCQLHRLISAASRPAWGPRARRRFALLVSHGIQWSRDRGAADRNLCGLVCQPAGPHGACSHQHPAPPVVLGKLWRREACRGRRLRVAHRLRGTLRQVQDLFGLVIQPYGPCRHRRLL
jgi:hypothetical protein